ncbi:proprotein convertase P-domain-containing protein [candidate division KSB1 bacterium]|nr:proprotein convertase P-domain-containing protein [candidate division KSB1 bacterium]
MRKRSVIWIALAACLLLLVLGVVAGEKGKAVLVKPQGSSSMLMPNQQSVDPTLIDRMVQLKNEFVASFSGLAGGAEETGIEGMKSDPPSDEANKRFEAEWAEAQAKQMILDQVEAEAAAAVEVEPWADAKAALDREAAGGALSPADKALIAEYENIEFAGREGGHGDPLDDNGGTTFTWVGAPVTRIPVSGTGGTSADTVHIPLTVSGIGTYIVDVEVQIDSLLHTYDSDLDIFLTSPAGTRLELSTDNGSTGDNMIRTRFDDDAAALITTGVAPMTGSYRPEVALTAFDTQDPNGVWTLTIYDDLGGDTGGVFQWSIQILTANLSNLHDFACTTILAPVPGNYPSGATLAVTARAVNFGTTTEPGTLNYSFNGGATVTEVTQSLAQLGTEDHPFTPQITLPALDGPYVLTVWTEVAGDADAPNDTSRVTVTVRNGTDCGAPVLLAGASGTQLYNNCGAGDNLPGQPCGASGQDMIFRMVVPAGNWASIWQPSNSIDSRHTARWGGACPGTNLLHCVDSPDEARWVWYNGTGATETLYLTVGLWSLTATCGNFNLNWDNQPCVAATVPFTENFDTAVPVALPTCWSFENVNAITPIWESYATTPRSAPNSASISGTASSNNDWLFTKPITLTGGITYLLEYWRRAASITSYDSVEVFYGTTNQSSAMTNVIHVADTVKTTAYALKAATFTPAVSGDYVIGWHNISRFSGSRLRIDDIALTLAGGCTAPTVTVNSAVGIGQVTLAASVTGGSGGAVEYQWFTGTGCEEVNRIVGQRAAGYTTTSSGVFSCRAWILDSLNCATCDSAEATVTPPPPGDNCSIAVTLTGVRDSLVSVSNCGYSDQTPGQSCGYSKEDMVYSMSVPAGNVASIWQSLNALDSRHSLRWGGVCPGDNLVGCIDDPDYTQYYWTNNTGLTQTVYYVIGGYSTTTPCGTYTLQWLNQACTVQSIPYADNFDDVPSPLLPFCWNSENADALTPVWATYTTSPRSSPNSASLAGSATGNNDWLFSEALDLTGGTSYTLEYYRRAASVTNYDSLEVKFGNAPNSAAMTTAISAPETLQVTTYTLATGTFTPALSGTYYVGWHGMSRFASARLYIDDVFIYPTGACGAPTVTVNSVAAIGSVTLTANAAGGYGGVLAYQWYTGDLCQAGNEILGANSNTYQTVTSGVFSVKAWRADPDVCAACDSAEATILPIPQGDQCNNPLILPAPAPNDSSIISGSTTGWSADCSDSCNSTIARSSGPDAFVQITLTECRRLAFALDNGTVGSGDMYIAVYAAGSCCTNTILCNDDISAFTVVYWEVAGQRGSSLNSFVAGSLEPGTYIVRVGYYGSSSGAWRLRVFDNGACPCNVACEGGDIAEPAENRFDPTFPTTDPDGGCNNTVPVFLTPSCGQSYCGVLFDYLAAGTTTIRAYYRDTDWYQFTLASDQIVTLQLATEDVPLTSVLYSGAACGSLVALGADSTTACDTLVFSDTLTTGTYTAAVAARYFTGNPSPLTYRATLTCASLCAPDTVVDFRMRFANIDADPVINDLVFMWDPDPLFAGTYTIWANTTLDPVFPGTWTSMATGIPAPSGPNVIAYVYDDGAAFVGPRRYFLVTGTCP